MINRRESKYMFVGDDPPQKTLGFGHTILKTYSPRRYWVAVEALQTQRQWQRSR